MTLVSCNTTTLDSKIFNEKNSFVKGIDPRGRTVYDLESEKYKKVTDLIKDAIPTLLKPDCFPQFINFQAVQFQLNLDKIDQAKDIAPELSLLSDFISDCIYTNIIKRTTLQRIKMFMDQGIDPLVKKQINKV